MSERVNQETMNKQGKRLLGDENDHHQPTQKPKHNQYPKELQQWVLNNLQMELSDDTEKDVDKALESRIALYDKVKEQIWNGKMPVRIANDITVSSQGNIKRTTIAYERWEKRLSLPIHVHNTKKTWTHFFDYLEGMISEGILLEEQQKNCIDYWEHCVAVIDSTTLTEPKVVLKTADNSEIAYQTITLKAFENVLKKDGIRCDFDLPELFAEKKDKFSYTTVEYCPLSFAELDQKWHPDCLYVDIGAHVEHNDAPNIFSQQRCKPHLDAILELALHFCGGNNDLYLHFLKWIGWKIRNLSKRTGVAVTIAGPKNSLKSGFLRWLIQEIFGPHSYKNLPGLFGLFSDNYNQEILEGPSMIHVDEPSDQPLSGDLLERFKNLTDDLNTNMYTRAIRKRWKRLRVQLELLFATNCNMAETFPFKNLYSPTEQVRRILALVFTAPVPPELRQACILAFKSGPFTARMFADHCLSLLDDDKDFYPNRDIPETEFIAKMRGASIQAQLLQYFQKIPEFVKNRGKVSLKDVAEALGVSSKAISQTFREMKPQDFPLKSLEIKEGQSVRRIDGSKRDTNVSCFCWHTK